MPNTASIDGMAGAPSGTGTSDGAGAPSANTSGMGALAVIPTTALAGAPDGSPGLSVPMPFANRIVLIDNTHVAGTTHIRDISAIVEQLSEGQELTLVRDTNNTQDAWAIRVLAGGTRIGYVPADRNEILARLMDGGKKLGARITGMELLGNWHKIHLEVYLDD